MNNVVDVKDIFVLDKISSEKYNYQNMKDKNINFASGELKTWFGGNIDKLVFDKNGLGLILDQHDNTLGICVKKENIDKLTLEELQALVNYQNFDIIDYKKLNKKDLLESVNKVIK